MPGSRMIWAALLRADCPPVVGVVQPGALVRTPWRARRDRRGGHRGKAVCPPVDCRRRDGQLELHPRDPDAERRPRGAGRRSAVVSHPALAAPPWSSLSCSAVCRGWSYGPVASTPTGRSDFHWRWTKTPEELLLAQAGDRAPRRRLGAGAKAAEPVPVAAEIPKASPPVKADAPAKTEPAAPAALSEACGVARLSRTRARRRGSRRADRDGLVAVAAGPAVAPRRSARAGRRSRSAATSFTRRSSAAATRSSPVTG